MKQIAVIFALAIAVSASAAQQSKQLELNAPVKSQQQITLKDFSGAELTVTPWDKPAVLVRLKIEVSSSDDKWEEEYMKSVKLEEEQTEREVTIRFEQPSMPNSGFSLKKLLSLNFGSYVRKEVRGEVFVPKSNPFSAEIRYGKVDVSDVSGPLTLSSQSGNVSVRNCANVKTIENNYGTTNLESCGGSMDLSNRSGKVTIDTFDGNLDIHADYSNVEVRKATGNVQLKDQSGRVTLTDVGGRADLDADYSRIELDHIGGFVHISGKSGIIKVESVPGATIDAPYTTIDVSGVSGASGKPIAIKTISGRVDVADAQGDLQLEAPYSNINIRTLVGNVNLQTKSGAVDADRVKGNWTSSTQYSRVTIRELSAREVSLTNSSGTIDLNLETLPASLDINNSYADVNVRLPKGLSADVRLKAEYGKISSDLPVKVERMGSGELAVGLVGSGKGTFRIETLSGSIRIDEE